MSRRIHYIDLYVVVHHGAVLGIYRDTSFSFYIIAVHDTVHHLLVVPEHTALIQERIHQC